MQCPAIGSCLIEEFCGTYYQQGVPPCASKLVEAAPSASANTGSMPLCRTCIKLYACIKSGDNIDGCTEHEHYAPQQHAGA